jgi:hypothetical protein
MITWLNRYIGRGVGKPALWGWAFPPVAVLLSSAKPPQMKRLIFGLATLKRRKRLVITHIFCGDG